MTTIKYRAFRTWLVPALGAAMATRDANNGPRRVLDAEARQGWVSIANGVLLGALDNAHVLGLEDSDADGVAATVVLAVGAVADGGEHRGPRDLPLVLAAHATRRVHHTLTHLLIDTTV